MMLRKESGVVKESGRGGWGWRLRLVNMFKMYDQK